MMTRLIERQHEQFFDTTELTAEQAEAIGEYLANMQRGINWYLGDLARYARYGLRLGDDKFQQVFPEWVSPGLIARCEAVALAYPNEADRNPLATWSQHKEVANKPNRIELVAQMVDKGETSDESRQRLKKGGWLLAVDVSLFVCRWYHAGVQLEAGSGVASWVGRTVERLKAKGLSDCVCAIDSDTSFRKAITANWPDKYKDRPPKEPELIRQLQIAREQLEKQGFTCVMRKDHEADDVLASCACQFKGQVTLLTQDKDVRQCLSSSCNMLLDVEWEEDQTSGEMLPQYKWLDAATHTEQTSIPPEYWVHFQALMGDSGDNITGVSGVGKKIAASLIKEYGSVQDAIEAAKDENTTMRPRLRQSLLEFEEKAKDTLKLVTLRTDLEIPTTTRI